MRRFGESLHLPEEDVTEPTKQEIEATIHEGARDAFALVTSQVLKEQVAPRISAVLEKREHESDLDREIRVRGCLAALAGLAAVMQRTIASLSGDDDPLRILRAAIATIERDWAAGGIDGQHRTD